MLAAKQLPAEAIFSPCRIRGGPLIRFDVSQRVENARFQKARSGADLYG